MENDKPMLRHEEYVALSEENRRLAEEVHRLRELRSESPKAKAKTKKTPWLLATDAWLRSAPDGVVGAVIVLIGLGIGLWQGISHDLKNYHEKSGTVFCYTLAQRRVSNPWEPWYIHEIRIGRNGYWDTKEEGGGYYTRRDAEDVLRKWGVKVCPFDLRDAREQGLVQ